MQGNAFDTVAEGDAGYSSLVHLCNAGIWSDEGIRRWSIEVILYHELFIKPENLSGSPFVSRGKLL